MKLLLTSNGLTNDSIKNALEELAGKAREVTRIAFIPTAAFCEDDHKHESRDWLADDIYNAKEFCGYFDMVSLADLEPSEVLARLEYADIILVGGGNAFYLSYWMEKSGLFEALPKLLETRVYMGISAGTMIATQSLRTVSHAIRNPQSFYDEKFDEFGPRARTGGKTAKLVDFVVRPHLGVKSFPDGYLEAVAHDVQVPVYALDDSSAVKVVDGIAEIISEGEWKILQ